MKGTHGTSEVSVPCSGTAFTNTSGGPSDKWVCSIGGLRRNPHTALLCGGERSETPSRTLLCDKHNGRKINGLSRTSFFQAGQRRKDDWPCDGRGDTHRSPNLPAMPAPRPCLGGAGGRHLKPPRVGWRAPSGTPCRAEGSSAGRLPPRPAPRGPLPAAVAPPTDYISRRRPGGAAGRLPGPAGPSRQHGRQGGGQVGRQALLAERAVRGVQAQGAHLGRRAQPAEGEAAGR